jgi:hypothetical protein
MAGLVPAICFGRPNRRFKWVKLGDHSLCLKACANELIDSFSTGLPFDICHLSAAQPLIILSERRNSADPDLGNLA